MGGFNSPKFPKIPEAPAPPPPAPIPGAVRVRAPKGQKESQRLSRFRGSSRLRIPKSNVNIPR